MDIEECTNDGLCEKVCPILNKKIFENHLVAYAYINKDNKIRGLSSSESIFNVIAENVIAINGVVFRTDFN